MHEAIAEAEALLAEIDELQAEIKAKIAKQQADESTLAEPAEEPK